MEVVTRSIRTVDGDECADNIQKGLERLRKLAMTTDGLKQIQTWFRYFLFDSGVFARATH